MSNQSPIIYLSLNEDGNISIATRTPAKHVPTAVHEAVHKGEVTFASQWVDLPPVSPDDIGFCLASDEQIVTMRDMTEKSGGEGGGMISPNWVREEIVKAAMVDRAVDPK